MYPQRVSSPPQPVVNVADTAIQTFGKYQLLERIATGGMAEIYKARLEGIGGFQRTFAIKRILPNLSQNSDYIGMLVDEAKVAGLLSHANIVQILELQQVDGIWFIAMEYVDGRDLGAILRRANRKGLCLPVPHTVFITIELLKALEYAHQRQVMKGGRAVALNIIHRDVSPPNVLLSFQGEVKLTDFGIARASLKAMETVTGIVKGRFDYMSPEQAVSSPDLDQRSDLFSVGVLLYEMLTGHHPFRTESEMGTIERVKAGQYVPVSERNAEVPFTLETIVDTALRNDPQQRYASATAFKEALDQFFHDAGFIFTHATLASYVRGLFPNRDQGHGADSDPGFELASHLPNGGDGPTRRLDRRGLRPPDDQAASEAFQEEETDLRSRPLEAFLDEDDQQTLIRKMPEGWDDDPPGSPAGSTGAVRPSQPPPDPRAPRSAPPAPSSPWDEQAPRIRRGIDEDPILSASGRSVDGVERTSATSTGRRTKARGLRGPGMVAWATAIVGLFLGLSLGSATTGFFALLAGFRFVGIADPTLADPQIHVVAPPGTQVVIDGNVVGKRVDVTAGELHRVEVTLQGQPPWTEELVLNRGEHRVLILGRP